MTEWNSSETPSIMLDTQYRMHPSLSKFPSAEFYDLALRDGTRDDSGNIPTILLPPSSQHLAVDGDGGPSVVFLDHIGQENTKARSRVNYDEVNIVCDVISDLLLRNPVRVLAVATEYFVIELCVGSLRRKYRNYCALCCSDLIAPTDAPN